MADEELASAKNEVEELDEQLQWHLIPKDPDDERNIYLEIRAGTGGDEAAILPVIFTVCIFAMQKNKAGNRN